MNEFNVLKDILAQFEDVSIYIHELRINLVRDTSKLFSAYTNVWEGVHPHYKVKGCELTGNVHILFRNQGNDFSSCLLTYYVLSASSEVDNSHRSVFSKLIQYLFDRMNDYCKENRVKDSKGDLFVLPTFGYSKDDFHCLPDEPQP